MHWFEVDKVGLAKLLERRGKAWALFELISNAWDQNVTKVRVSLTKDGRYATINVEDDDPNGFATLSHAFTLFAESAKKDDPTQRGRFNLGEKLVLALCDEAEIITTTGGIRFDAEGRHALRRKRETGSLFHGRLKMTNAEFDECVTAVHRLIPPAHIVTTFSTSNFKLDEDQPLVTPTPISVFEATLATELADPEGILRRSKRKTSVRVYEAEDDCGWLYELGIPVVETGDSFHVDIGQKVPLNLDRDNVTPAFLRDVRTLVLNAVHDRITDSEVANSSWVRDALADENIESEAVKAMVTLRFGEKAVTYDPSDREANNRAILKGYTVVHGNQMSKAEWNNVRRAEVLQPAGKVMPTPKPYGENGGPVPVIDWQEMTEAEQRVIKAYRKLCATLVGYVQIRLVSTDNNFVACYGDHTLDLNRRKLGRNFFADCLLDERLTETAIDLLIHELGHEYSGNHLSDGYHEALTKLGAKLVLAVADNKTLLRV